MAHAEPISTGIRPYEVFTAPLPPIDSAELDHIIGGVLAIARIEGPVTGSRLLRAYVNATGRRRIGSQSRLSINLAVARAIEQGILIADNPLKTEGYEQASLRLPDQPAVILREAGPRELDEIPALELFDHLRVVQNERGIEDLNDLFRTTLQRLGWRRLGANLEDHFRTVWSTFTNSAEAVQDSVQHGSRGHVFPQPEHSPA